MGTSTDGRKGRRELRDDTGTSLVELLVGMAVLSIFLGLFTGAVIELNQATNKAQAISLTSEQLNAAFITLDRSVRYAAAISVPGCTGAAAPSCDAIGTTPGAWYVEFRTTNTGSELCTQLRLTVDDANSDSEQLQTRSWTSASAPDPFDLSSFTTIASGVTKNSTAKPFVLTVAGSYQQLNFNFSSLSVSGSSQTTSDSSFTVNALDSSNPPSATSVCQLGRP